jgi:hypothetical protein
MIRTLLVALLLGLCAGASAQSTPATPEPGPNDACLACHGDPGAKAASGRSVAVDPARYGGSVHGAMSLPCTACHTDVTADKFPHGEVKPAACGSCHDKAANEYAATIHGKARANGKTAAATCADCHGSHDIQRAIEPGARTHHAKLESTCAKCHGNEAMIAQANIPGGNVARLYHDSIHGQAINKKTGMQDAAPTCTNCHGAHDMRPKSDPASRVARANIPDTCGACHANVKETWASSQHGKLRQANVLQAPGCTDCHSAHDIQRHDLPQWQLAVIGECGTCHQDSIGSYRDTFHGQVTQLGYTRVATCSSCHGAHDILPKSDPKSRISPQNVVATCQGCHPKANVNFAKFDPHPNRHDRESGQLLYYTGKFMDLLLIGVFGFFGLHTLLWLRKSLQVVRENRRRARSGQGNQEKH